MEYITDPKLIIDKTKQFIKQEYSIGLVPTMGFFHEGHLSLMDRAREECDKIIVSLFVNPMQFAPNEDLEIYPRDIERDKKLAEKRGVDILLHLKDEDIYPTGFKTRVIVDELSNKLCGISRPKHFAGVTTIVCKLFNLTSPTIAYFGQKDAQQSIIIKRMVKDLNMGIKIKVMPIVRESDGLAMSSRNSYLKPKERIAARCLYRALKEAEIITKRGERYCNTILKRVNEIIKKEPLAKIDYIALVDIQNLSKIDVINQESLLALAVWFGKTRLIDNITLSPVD